MLTTTKKRNPVKRNPVTGTVDVSKALDLRVNHNLSYQDIGNLQGVSKQAIHSAIKHLLPDNDTKLYQDNRADILSHIQVKLLRELDSERLKKASAFQLVGAAGLLYDKERIERGQTTENIGIITGTIKEIQAFRQRRAEELSTGSDNTDNVVK